MEHEYVRGGAWVYLAAWDVRRAQLFGRCEARSGKVPFDRLVAHVMAQEPYRSATRVFWVLDNGSAHRGAGGVFAATESRLLLDGCPRKPLPTP